MKFPKYFIVLIVFMFVYNLVSYIDSEKINIHKTKELKLLAKQMPNTWYMDQRVYPYKSIDKQAYRDAIRYKEEHKSDSRDNEMWELVGPTNVGGRITDVEVANTNPPIIYAGSAAGGIFKTTESNAVWDPISDLSMDMSIGDIAIAPSNQSVLYVGTGEPNGGGGSLSYDGSGMFKSMDSGDSWEHIGLEDVGSVGKVLVHPTDSDICYVGAMGTLFRKSNNRGVYRTIDGGDNWEQVFYINDSIGVIDMAMDPLAPSILYAATWERTRTVANSNYSGYGSGIYKSTNGGETWNRLTIGLPATAGRIGISISASHPHILYANFTDPWTRGLEGVYRTDDSGYSWKSTNITGIDDAPYMWWFGGVFVHPTDPNIVYINSLDMYKTVDGGENWSITFDGVHADQHSVSFYPNNPDKIVIGNDGGVYISNNGGDIQKKLNGLPVSQFYTCEIDNQDPSVIYGGTQDNGTIRTLSGDEDDWHRVFGGDGFRVIVHPSISDIIFVEYQYGNIFYSNDRGASFNYIKPDVSNMERQNWNTPFELDLIDETTLYYGTNKLYVSTDFGSSWELTSDDLTKNNSIGNLPYGTITTISVSRVDNDVIWIGTDDGNVQMSKDKGSSWTLVSSFLPNRWVTSVKADPNDKNSAYVTFSGYKYGEVNGHVYKTNDLGSSWINKGDGLPDIPINDIVINTINLDLYIATDIGVFVSENDGETWELLGSDLPDIGIMNLDYHAPTDKLIAATFGRGIYQVLLNSTVAVEEKMEEKEVMNISPNPFVDHINVSLNSIDESNVKLEITDIRGVLMYSQLLETNDGLKDLNVNTSSFRKGIYLVSLTKGNNTLGTTKLVK